MSRAYWGAVVGVVALATGVAIATSVDAQPGRGNRPCLAPERTPARVQAVAAINRRSFERSARSLGLDPTSVTRWTVARTLTHHTGALYGPFREPGATEGDAAGGPPMVAGAARNDLNLDEDLFARDRHGAWHLVILEPQEGRARRIVECGCAWHCGGFAARQWWRATPTCHMPGGAPPPPPITRQPLYAIPAGANLGPPMTVQYRSIPVHLEPSRVCPPPP